ncbi:MAG: hypothetical protein CR974_00875 [Gammaproteobacteria bacterium]|nr:MAG: hypothetical protein CR974_00875 [Gammaproteobacteria bacterium]
MKKLLLTLTVAMALTASATEHWKMATPYATGGLHDRTNHYFAKQLQTATDGKYEITIYPAGELVTAKQMLQTVHYGDKAQLGEVLGSMFAQKYPVWAMDSLPFLADSYEKAERLWKVSRETVARDLEKEGLILLYAVPWPGQNFYTKAQLNDVSVLSGKKMFTYNKLLAKLAKFIEAEPVKYNVNVLGQAFEQGKVDFALVSSSTGVKVKLWEHTKYYTKINAYFPKALTFISKNVWDELDKETQDKILVAAQQAEAHGWALSKTEHFGQEAVLIENGMHSEAPNVTVRQAFFKIGQKLTKEWYKHTNKAAKKVMKAYRGY